MNETLTQKIDQIQVFLSKNGDPAVIAKYSKYFKDGYDAYGVDGKLLDPQRKLWMESWKDMQMSDYLDLGDKLVETGKFENISCAIYFISAFNGEYTKETFDRVGGWLETGIRNWGSTDVLCMLVLKFFIMNKVVKVEDFSAWVGSPSVWKRRAVPVTYVELVKKKHDPKPILKVIDALMMDNDEYVQKGLGTLLREVWKKEQLLAEDFLLKWKDICGRKIIQYATEKMDKEAKVRFKKTKK